MGKVRNQASVLWKLEVSAVGSYSAHVSVSTDKFCSLHLSSCHNNVRFYKQQMFLWLVINFTFLLG